MKALTLPEFIRISYLQKGKYIFISTNSTKPHNYNPSLWDDLSQHERSHVYIEYYNNLLSRKFNLDMITGLFEEWEELYPTSGMQPVMTRKNIMLYNGAHSICLSKTNMPENQRYISIETGVNHNYKIYQFPIPRTINDFLNFCDVAGIELKFKPGALK